MAAYPPPIENVPIFNASLFEDSDDANINVLSNYFLRYPNAQGTENLQTITVSGLSVFNNKIDQNLSNNNIQFGDSNTYNAITTGSNNIFIGTGGGSTLTTGSGKVAIGTNAGSTGNANNTVAIGENAGETSQGINAIAIGANAGRLNQGLNSIIISSASATQNNTNDRNIIINANSAAIVPITGTDRCYITPIRGAIDVVSNQFIMQGSGGSEVVKISKTALVGPFGVSTSTATTTNPIISAQTTDAGNGGAYIEVYKNSASPAVADDIGGISFSSTDSLGAKQLYSRILSFVEDPITATVNGSLTLQCKFNGADTNYLQVNGGDDTIRMNTNGGERMRLLTSGCLNIGLTSTPIDATTKLQVSGPVEIIGSNALNFNGLSTTNNSSFTQNVSNTAGKVQFFNRSGNNGGFLFRSSPIGNSTANSIYNALDIQSINAAPGGGFYRSIFGNFTNKNNIEVIGNMSVSEDLFSNSNFDPCGIMPYSNSVGGTKTVLCQTYDPILPNTTSVPVAGVFFGAAVKYVENTFYSGIQIFITNASTVTNITVGAYSTNGILLGSGSLAVGGGYTINRPTNIDFSSPFSSTSQLGMIGYIATGGGLTIRSIAYSVGQYQSAVINTFDLRGFTVAAAPAPPSNMSGTPIVASNVPWYSLY